MCFPGVGWPVSPRTCLFLALGRRLQWASSCYRQNWWVPCYCCEGVRRPGQVFRADVCGYRPRKSLLPEVGGKRSWVNESIRSLFSLAKEDVTWLQGDTWWLPLATCFSYSEILALCLSLYVRLSHTQTTYVWVYQLCWVMDGGSKWLEKLRNGPSALCCVFMHSSVKSIPPSHGVF